MQHCRVLPQLAESDNETSADVVLKARRDLPATLSSLSTYMRTAMSIAGLIKSTVQYMTGLIVKGPWKVRTKLQWPARQRLNRLMAYDVSWAQWKVGRYSPIFTGSLEELVLGRSTRAKTWRDNYHEKLTLRERCKVAGDNTVVCIIRGLPIEV